MGIKEIVYAQQYKVIQTTKVIPFSYISVTQLILRGDYKSFTRNEMYTFLKVCFKFNALQSFLTCVSVLCMYSPIPLISRQV